MKKVLALLFVFVAVMIPVFANGTGETSSVTLTLSEVHAEGYPTTLADYRFAELVAERTEGRQREELLSTYIQAAHFMVRKQVLSKLSRSATSTLHVFQHLLLLLMFRLSTLFSFLTSTETVITCGKFSMVLSDRKCLKRSRLPVPVL